ncbi:MAG: hypothetical protein IJK66_00310 [Bacilli bacterium]|nr:hypothetical protein [Bacilli bacterium]
MKDNINALDELNKGTSMGKDTIDYVLDKVEEKRLKSILNNQKKEYERLLDKIARIYPKYNDNKEPHEINRMEKAMAKKGVEMRLFVDDSSSKISELFLKGTNMGIIEGRRLLNNKNIDKRVHSLISEFVNMQEAYVEKLKAFL